MPPEHRIHIGGLMRCCLATIERLTCSCRIRIVYRQGAWAWSEAEVRT